MLNRPFSATNTNVFDENFVTSCPANISGQQVLVNQEQHRKMFDTLTTSISAYPQCQPNCGSNGVTFTFNRPPPPPCYCPQQSNNPFGRQFPQPPTWQCQPASPLQHQWNPFHESQQRQALERALLNQQLPDRSAFHLRFHLDHQTSTSDFLAGSTQVPGSKSAADFRNLSGINGLQRPHYSHRKLILNRVNKNRLNTSIVEDLEKDATATTTDERTLKRDGKQVGFADDGADELKSVETQATFGCPCCQSSDDEARGRKRCKAKKKSRRKMRSYSSSSEIEGFIEQWTLDTFNCEDVFRNQVDFLNETAKLISRNDAKAEFINGRMYLLQCLEAKIQCDFCYIAQNITKIEALIGNLEKQLLEFDQKVVPDCTTRHNFYLKAEDVFTSLRNCDQVLQLINDKIIGDDAEMAQTPAYLVFKILGENLNTLESLSFSSTKCLDVLNEIEILKKKFVVKLYSK